MRLSVSPTQRIMAAIDRFLDLALRQILIQAAGILLFCKGLSET
jgi:hypothetical protein